MNVCDVRSAAYGEGFSAASKKSRRAANFQRGALLAFPQGSMKPVATPRTSARRAEAVSYFDAKGGGRYRHTKPAWARTGG